MTDVSDALALDARPRVDSNPLEQAGTIAVIAVGSTFAVWVAASAALGLGTAMVYPTLLAAVADLLPAPG